MRVDAKQRVYYNTVSKPNLKYSNETLGVEGTGQIRTGICTDGIPEILDGKNKKRKTTECRHKKCACGTIHS